MNIILGEDQYQALKDQYIVLKLDTLVINGDKIPSYCVLDAKSIPLDEMTQLDHWRNNHNKIIENYHKRNFAFVEQMIEHCRNRWGGELESFYIDLYARTQKFKKQKLPDNWTGYIEKD